MATNGTLAPRPANQDREYFENGRAYTVFRKGKYLFPCDESEMDRMDIYHRFFHVARRESLHWAQFTPNKDLNRTEGPRILDLGCGSGIWAIDMADLYHAQKPEVHGYDLAFIQPASIPEGLTFFQRDIESPWHGVEQDSWDFIHMRMLNGSISNWPSMYGKIIRHLRPGVGVFEQVEMDYIPRCDDGTLPANSAMIHWTRLLFEAMEEAGRPMTYNPTTRATLQHAGFTDVQEHVIKCPVNAWSTDSHQKEIGRWYNLGLTQGIDGLALAPLTRIKGWTADDVFRLCAEVKREICSKEFHVYHNMHIWIARRPAT